MPVRKVKLSQTSWIDVHENVLEYTKEEFDTMWDLHPIEHHKVIVYGKEHEIPRWQKLYGVDGYEFSGTVSKDDLNIPDFVQKCFEVANRLYPSIKFNGALVNWYENGDNYIGPHSDNESSLVKGTPILSFSFGGVRTFRISLRKDAKGDHNKEDHNKEDKLEKLDIPTINNSLIVMGGNMQKEYKHEITKTKKKVDPRINVTIRSFKTD